MAKANGLTIWVQRIDRGRLGWLQSLWQPLKRTVRPLNLEIEFSLGSSLRNTEITTLSIAIQHFKD